ncbi:MAG: methyltransferase domain-containing protein [Rhodobacter sp.]|nr:methyltransferase domain-containing protein [Rhodobacter sp.]
MGTIKERVATVGDDIEAGDGAWTFGGNTPKTFNDHVRKSVPYYLDGHDLTLALSNYFVQPGSVGYEVGSSTGALTRKLAERYPRTDWVGLDVAKEMVDEARRSSTGHDNLTFAHASAAEFDFEPTDFIVSYYTMQFIRPRERQQFVDRIYNALNWGGAFIVFEKVRAPDARFQDMMSGIYVDYKLEQGYSASEILGKTKSLKGVLEPFSTQGNLDLFKRAGFVDVMSIFKYVCFEGFLCVK